ncbi:sporulation protein YqfC [Thermosediminibacter oceani]|uniref:Sporulation protein YqfC n=1 Tax=Thermosediminibacter oceani (strain ATCC BAA-1034 / DSM 16646 / JW/IW-1228P) TaxID=555079 RepID=D9S2Q2_THEOJ|nr:sporulation protein YqfC [Thermosediminibacter oceani]ADL07679.1 sporulation protein YqfC [Thermosediminibacter oceani DSM 16646]
MKRTNQESLRARISDALELPKDIVLDLPRITVIGKISVFIENHKGILEYGTDKVCVNTNIGLLVIKGRELILKSIVADEIVVEGKIESLEFEE